MNTDISSLILKKPVFDEVDNRELAEQIEAKKKAEDKLPTWFGTPLVYYPNKLNIEQTSSETTARYKAGLVSGNTLLDITGGLGVDALFFSRQFTQVTHCEINPNLHQIAAYNAPLLGADTMEFIQADGIGYLQASHKKFDCIYIDPSRRTDAKGKVFMLQDCLPDVPGNLDVLFAHTECVLIKTSPILDISVALTELKNVAEVYVVALNNEVKELLWLLKKGYEGELTMKSVNLETEQPAFCFNPADEGSMEAVFSIPRTYLYEPNAAILKAGAFKTIGHTYGLRKLHPHSHLYTSDALVDFPGRIFVVDEVVPYQKKQIKDRLQGTKANITSRNFPDKPEVFRKQYKIKDGGNVYIFLTTNYLNEKIVILTHKAS